MLVVPPYVLYLTGRESTGDAKIAELVENFRETYGYEAIIVSIVNPKEIYVVYWESVDAVNASLRLDGLWVIVASTPKQEEE